MHAFAIERIRTQDRVNDCRALTAFEAFFDLSGYFLILLMLRQKPFTLKNCPQPPRSPNTASRHCKRSACRCLDSTPADSTCCFLLHVTTYFVCALFLQSSDSITDFNLLNEMCAHSLPYFSHSIICADLIGMKENKKKYLI